MKYIDAEKLIAEIERRIKELDEQIVDIYDSKAILRKDELQRLLSIIDSLQQEQPKVDLVAELKHHLATTSKEQLEKEWKELEPWNNIGPTVQEFLYGKQPEVDLEKEVGDFWDTVYGKDRRYTRSINIYDFRNFARHFYELGLNARKGESL